MSQTATAAFRLPRSVLPTLSLLLAAFLWACGDREGAGTRASSERTVRNTRESGWSTERAWRLSPAGVIAGTGGGGAPISFGNLVGVAIDPLGRVWAADGMQQAIHVFEWGGRHVRTIGRQGAGPAEFAGIAGMAWAPDGTLWVLDAGNGRFSVFDTAGVPASTVSRRHPASVTPWPGAFDRHGRLVDLAQRRLVGDEVHVALVRSDPRAAGGDTLRLAPLKERYFGEVTSGHSPRQSVRRAPIPFTATQLWAVDPEGFAWVAVTDRYRVERTAFDGTIDLALELERPARPVSRADKARILENYRWLEEAGAKLDASQIPDRYPQLQSLFVDDEGYLWVAPTYLHRERPVFDVFGKEGAFLGRVTAPAPLLTTPSPAIRGDRMAAVARNADGVDRIITMHLLKPGR